MLPNIFKLYVVCYANIIYFIFRKAGFCVWKCRRAIFRSAFIGLCIWVILLHRTNIYRGSFWCFSLRCKFWVSRTSTCCRSSNRNHFFLSMLSTSIFFKGSTYSLFFGGMYKLMSVADSRLSATKKNCSLNIYFIKIYF